MIRVLRKPEPEGFDAQVRQEGLRWLREKQIEPTKKLPKGQKIPPIWRGFLEELYERYDGVCAYYAFKFELSSGAASTDHFVAKSSLPCEAYEWSNYRLACLAANSKKSVHARILDPFDLEEETFRLNLDTGEISVNPNKPKAIRIKAQRTITKIGLDSVRLTKMRAKHWEGYNRNKFPADYLQEFNPFVYAEALRQGRL